MDFLQDTLDLSSALHALMQNCVTLDCASALLAITSLLRRSSFRDNSWSFNGYQLLSCVGEANAVPDRAMRLRRSLLLGLPLSEVFVPQHQLQRVITREMALGEGGTSWNIAEPMHVNLTTGTVSSFLRFPYVPFHVADWLGRHGYHVAVLCNRMA